MQLEKGSRSKGGEGGGDARKTCDLFLRSKVCSMCRGQKRSRMHISTFLTCCIDVAGGGGRQ